jgi:hypothetical protein
MRIEFQTQPKMYQSHASEECHGQHVGTTKGLGLQVQCLSYFRHNIAVTKQFFNIQTEKCQLTSVCTVGTRNTKRLACEVIQREMIAACSPSLLLLECEPPTAEVLLTSKIKSCIQGTSFHLLVAADVLLKSCRLPVGASSPCVGSASLPTGWMNVLNVFKCGNLEGLVDVAILMTVLTHLKTFFNPLVMLSRPMMARKIMHAVGNIAPISIVILSLLPPELPASVGHCCHAISFLRKMKVVAMMQTSQINDAAQQNFCHLQVLCVAYCYVD